MRRARSQASAKPSERRGVTVPQSAGCQLPECSQGVPRNGGCPAGTWVERPPVCCTCSISTAPGRAIAAIQESHRRGAFAAQSVAHILDQRRRARGAPVPLDVTLPDDPRVRGQVLVPRESTATTAWRAPPPARNPTGRWAMTDLRNRGC